MKECIVLAGGFGARLQSVVKDVPKCMAEVAGNPFLYYLFEYLEAQKFSHIVLSLGYKAEIVIEWIATQQRAFSVSYVIETEPLGTGGAIQFAFEKIEGNEAVVINGDTFFDVNTDGLFESNTEQGADLTIALKPMINFDRYGSVEIAEDKRVLKFNEKVFRNEGLINGGVYLVKKDLFRKVNLPEKFSFEKDVMENLLDQLKIYGFIQDSYFIDIGIPTDFQKANIDFKVK